MRRVLLLGVLLIGFTLPSEAAFSYSRTITIDHTKVGPNTLSLSNFPVLISTTIISLSTITASGGRLLNSSGFDLAFSTKDTSCSFLLNWDTETYNATTGAINVWVKVPAISSSTDTTLYLCYGDASISSYQGISTGAWDSNYIYVWHLPNGTSLTTNDSTANALNGTNNSMTATTGKIDGAAAGNGTSQYIARGDNAALHSSSGTTEVWVNTTSDTDINTFSFTDSGGSQNDTYEIEVGNGATSFCTNEVFTLFRCAAGGSDCTTGGPFDKLCYTNSNRNVLFDGNWHQIVTTANSVTDKFYLDGASVTITVGNGSADGAFTAQANITRFDLAALYYHGAPAGFWSGSLDEARVSNIARSDDWILTGYNNHNSPNTFSSIGSEVGPPASNTASSRGLNVRGGKMSIQGGKVRVQ